MLFLLLACADPTPYERPATIFSLAAVSTPAYADPDIPLGVRVTLDAASESFSGWETWPSLAATLSSGTWVGDTDAALSETVSEPTFTLWAVPDADAVAVDILAELTVRTDVYHAEVTVPLCPSPLGYVVLTADEAVVETDSVLTLTATVYTPSSGRPTAGTEVTFAVGTGTTATLQRTNVLTDATGVATTRVLVGSEPSTLSFTATATPPARPDVAGCQRDTVTSQALHASVLLAAVETADTGDTVAAGP